VNEKIKFSNWDIYKKISSLDLILISLYSLELKKKKGNFENLLKESFRLFPRTFCFKGIAQWPDARKLDRPLRTLRGKNLVKGDPESLFSLTLKGKKKALELIEKFYQKRLFNL